MMDDLQLFDVTQYLNAGQRADDVHARCSSTPISDHKHLVLWQVEEVVGTTAGVATADDADPRSRAHHEIFLLPDLGDIFGVGGFEVVGLEGVELGVAQSFCHAGKSLDIVLIDGKVDSLDLSRWGGKHSSSLWKSATSGR
jgi:hypothetical protein